MKAYIKPAIKVIRIKTPEMLASSLGESNVNIGGGYGPGPDGGAATNHRLWGGDGIWDNFEEEKSAP